jgi:hypothetical protein
MVSKQNTMVLYNGILTLTITIVIYHGIVLLQWPQASQFFLPKFESHFEKKNLPLKIFLPVNHGSAQIELKDFFFSNAKISFFFHF